MQQSISTPVGSFLFPPGARVAVIVVEIPADAEAAERTVSAVEQPSQVYELVPPESATPTASRPVYPDTPLARVEAIRHAEGDVVRKRAEWADHCGVSIREMTRATKAGALEHTTKIDGRDNGAVMISASALSKYLADVQAVREGRMQKPEWWADVHGSLGASVKSSHQQHQRAA